MKKKHSLGWIVPLVVIVLVLAGTYGFGYIYSGTHFLPNTLIDGEKADGSTADIMNTEISSKQEAPSLTVIQRDAEGNTVKETLNLGEAAGFRRQATTDELLNQQNRLLWFLSFFNTTRLTSETEDWQMDTDKLSTAIDELYSFKAENEVEPQDAYLTYEDGTFRIVPSTDGMKIQREAAVAAIMEGAKKAATSDEDVTVDLTEMYETAAVTQSDPALQDKLLDYLCVLEKEIKIQIPEHGTVEGEEVLKGDALKELILVNDLSFAVNTYAVEAYVQELSENYSISQYEYIDQTSLERDLTAAVLSDKNETIEAEWTMIEPPEEVRQDEESSQYEEESETTEESSETTEESSSNEESSESSSESSEESSENSSETTEESSENSNEESSTSSGEESEGKAEEGETCIYVSILDQYLWYYKNGELIVSCPVVTGNPNADYNSTTPTGTYEVLRISGASVLAGADYVEYVDYWIGFDYETYGGMLGFHDASWRTEFGGDIYLTDPSHGCVNMPTWAVAIMWENVEYGTKVVIY